MATKTLYVGNLPYSVTESELTAYFKAYGATNARIIEGRGFGFVDVAAEMLGAAIKERDQRELGGRKLTVNEAQPKAGGTSRGGYGGGNRSGYAGSARSSYGGSRGRRSW
jgi:RNA recognition motif-containing protein